MLVIDGGVGRLEVASQVGYEFNQLIDAEDSQKLEQAIIISEHKYRIERLLKNIGEEEAKEQQKTNILAGMKPQVNDLDLLKDILGVKHDHQVNLQDDVLALLKPLQLRKIKPNRQSAGKTTSKVGVKPKYGNTVRVLGDITNTKRSRDGTPTP